MNYQIKTAARASALIYGLGAGHKDGVWLIPANVCPAVPLALLQAGTGFEFIDIDPASLCMDVALATRRIVGSALPPIAGVIYVRSYGYTMRAEADLMSMRSALPEPAILVDDQCLCIPQTHLEPVVPNGADVILFSTGKAKVLDMGGGGYGVFFGKLSLKLPPTLGMEDARKAEAHLERAYKAAMARGQPIQNLKSLQAQPWIGSDAGPDWPQYQQQINSRLPAVMEHKQQLNRIYQEGFQCLAGITPLPGPAQNWRFNVMAERRDEFLALLFDSGLFASAHYYPASRLFGQYDCPEADKLRHKVLNLFNDTHFSTLQAERVVSLARDFYSRS